MVTINNYDEFAAYLGKNLGVSDYVELSQERINLFADATLDHSGFTWTRSVPPWRVPDGRLT